MGRPWVGFRVKSFEAKKMMKKKSGRCLPRRVTRTPVRRDLGRNPRHGPTRLRSSFGWAGGLFTLRASRRGHSEIGASEALRFGGRGLDVEYSVEETIDSGKHPQISAFLCLFWVSFFFSVQLLSKGWETSESGPGDPRMWPGRVPGDPKIIKKSFRECREAVQSTWWQNPFCTSRLFGRPGAPTEPF